VDTLVHLLRNTVATHYPRVHTPLISILKYGTTYQHLMSQYIPITPPLHHHYISTLHYNYMGFTL